MFWGHTGNPEQQRPEKHANIILPTGFFRSTTTARHPRYFLLLQPTLFDRYYPFPICHRRKEENRKRERKKKRRKRRKVLLGLVHLGR